jgi:hypothetical protein
MSTAAQSVLQQVLALPVEDQREIIRAVNQTVIAGERQLEDVLGKFFPLPPDAEHDQTDHNEWFVEAIESAKGLNNGPNSVR